MQLLTFKPTCNGFVRDKCEISRFPKPWDSNEKKSADEIPVEAFFHRLELLMELSVAFVVSIRNAGIVRIYQGSKKSLCIDKNGVFIYQYGFGYLIPRKEIDSVWLISTISNEKTEYSFEAYGTEDDLSIQISAQTGCDRDVWNDIVSSVPSIID